METKYTKGEWEVKHSESKPAYNIIGTVLGGKYKIARCPYYDMGDSFMNRKDKEEAEANAHLIAAAPDLLNAVESLPKWLRQAAEILQIHANRNRGSSILTPKLEWYADKLEAAIQKATLTPQTKENANSK